MVIKKDTRVEDAYNYLMYFLKEFEKVDKQSVQGAELEKEVIFAFNNATKTFSQEIKFCIGRAKDLAREITHTTRAKGGAERASLRGELDKLNNRVEWLKRLIAKTEALAESLNLLDKIERVTPEKTGEESSSDKK